MRRKEKEVVEISDIEAIIKKAVVCRLGLSDGSYPYIVPVCFGYQDQKLYIHSALEGQKIELLEKNQNVCIEFDIDSEIVEKDRACDWSIKFKSVIGFGKASFITNENKKIEALNIIMCQYSDRVFQYNEKALAKTAIIQIDIDQMTGKQSGYR